MFFYDWQKYFIKIFWFCVNLSKLIVCHIFIQSLTDFWLQLRKEVDFYTKWKNWFFFLYKCASSIRKCREKLTRSLFFLGVHWVQRKFVRIVHVQKSIDRKIRFKNINLRFIKYWNFQLKTSLVIFSFIGYISHYTNESISVSHRNVFELLNILKWVFPTE